MHNIITTLKPLRATKIIRYCITSTSYKYSTQNEKSIQSNRPSYFHHLGKEPLIFRTLGQQLSLAAQLHGDKEALLTLHEKGTDRYRMTFREILEKVDRLAAGFQNLGLKQGDRVGIWAPNNSIWFLTLMAAARCGLISVAINPAFQTPEIEFCLQKVRVKAIVAAEGHKTQNFYKMLSEIIPNLDKSKPGQIDNQKIPSLRTVIIDTKDKLNGAFRFDEILAYSNEASAKAIENIQSNISPDATCNIQFTSGTTGVPKAAYLSHFTILNNSYNILKRLLPEPNQKHRVLLQMPYFHVYGIVIGIVGTLHSGSTLVIPGPSFNAIKSVRALKEEMCTIIHGSPTMYVDVINKIKETNEKIDSLKIAVTGGSPCTPQLFENIKNILKPKRVQTVFGMTEGTGVAFQSFPSDPDEKVFNTVGHVQDHLEVKAVDVHGDTVPFGTPGELCVRGYSTMLGYWHDDLKTKEMIDEAKWLHTGDKIILSEDGYGKIVGRIKDMIIRGGENVFPIEIEDFLSTHPKILEVYVIGVPDERMGEEICAVVRFKKDQSLELDELKEYCKGKLAHFKIPRYLRSVDSFPKTTSGKIQKFKLRTQFTIDVMVNST